MKPKLLITILLTLLCIVSSQFVFALDTNTPKNLSEQPKHIRLTAIKYLQLMRKAYKELNYESIYLNTLQHKITPKQLIHGVIDGKEIVYFRYLNGAMRESLHFMGKISFFEQGAQSYSLKSVHNQSVFSELANLDFVKGQSYYEYIILGKSRIAGKQAIAIRIVSKDDYRYSYIIWLDMRSYLPLRLDTINKSNLILDQVMVVSLHVSKQVNPWLAKLSKQQLPQLLHFPEDSVKNTQKWKVNWLPAGFKIVKNNQHKLVMYKNEPISYILITDGVANASIYISEKKVVLKAEQKVIQRGATILYSYLRDGIEVNVVGDIPVETAKRLVESITEVD